MKLVEEVDIGNNRVEKAALKEAYHNEAGDKANARWGHG
jgi:hypothetical protein